MKMHKSDDAQNKGDLDNRIPEQISRYQIETIIEGELLRVVSINNAAPYGNPRYFPGARYGEDFAKAISEIGKNYTITNIDSILYFIGLGSITGEIYVHVRPRE